jgi:hypothetical protein
LTRPASRDHTRGAEQESYLAWLHRLRVRREALCYREVITDGIENAPGAFIGMLEGRSFGKTLVRVARGVTMFGSGESCRGENWTFDEDGLLLLRLTSRPRK